MTRFFEKPALIALYAFGSCVFSNDADIGRAFLSQGKIDEASIYIQRAWESDSVSPQNRLLYASIVSDAERARQLYLLAAEDSGAGIGVRAAAYVGTGEMFYAGGNYDSSVWYFQKARDIDPCDNNSWALARAATNAGMSEMTIAMLMPLTSGDDAKRVSLSRYYLGNSYMSMGEWVNARDSYRLSSNIEGSWWKASAAAGEILASARMGGSALENEVSGYDILPGAPKTKAGAGSPAGKYTLQVGAFASSENAAGLAEKLRAKYGDVTVSADKTGGKILHRVRVGLFHSREDAEKYAQKHLMRDGMTYRIVPE